MSTAVPSLLLLGRQDRDRRWLIAITAILAALAGGVLIAGAATGGHRLVVLAVPVLLLPLLVWRVPAAGMFVLLAASLVIEQFPIVNDGSDRLPFFTSVSDGLGLSGIYVNPAEVTVILFLLVWMLKAGVERWLSLPRSRVAAGFALFTLVVVVAEVRGLGHGGQFKESLWELRPWVYLALAYLLAFAVVRSRRALDAVLWLFVIGIGFKGLQGTLRYVQLRNVVPRPESILAHEEAFFFSFFILLVAGLWLFGQRGRLRGWATALLPTVVLADLANGRRNAWLMLAMGFIVLLVAAWIRLPDRRRLIRRLCAGVALASIVYVPLFWNSNATLGQPARALRSAIAPDARDRQSNQYRTLEDANLGYNIRHSTPFGEGFGVAIVYPIAIVDISNTNSLIKFVPHDGILYLWMRLGVPGILAFFWLIAAAFLAAGRLARAPDPRLALWGALILCALVGYLVQGYNDLGLYWFRIAIVMGALLGCLEAGTRLAAPQETAADATVSRVTP
jgi:hypothetical protein